jgi:hypothetical protein
MSPQAYPKIPLEKHEEGKKEATRRARMEFINNLDEDSREKLKKIELQVYMR